MDEETVEGLVEFSSTAVEDDRQHCPLCLTATSSIPSNQTLFKHIANHLESLATFSVPRNVNLADDDEKGGSNDPVQADDNDKRSWFSDIASGWSEDHEFADSTGVKVSLDQVQKHDAGSVDVVSEYLKTMQLSQLDDTDDFPPGSPGLGDTTAVKDLRSIGEQNKSRMQYSDIEYRAAATIERAWLRHLQERGHQPSLFLPPLSPGSPSMAFATTVQDLLSIVKQHKPGIQYSDTEYRAVATIERAWLRCRRERGHRRSASSTAPVEFPTATNCPKFLNQSKAGKSRESWSSIHGTQLIVSRTPQQICRPRMAAAKSALGRHARPKVGLCSPERRPSFD